MGGPPHMHLGSGSNRNSTDSSREHEFRDDLGLWMAPSVRVIDKTPGRLWKHPICAMDPGSSSIILCLATTFLRLYWPLNMRMTSRAHFRPHHHTALPASIDTHRTPAHDRTQSTSHGAKSLEVSLIKKTQSVFPRLPHNHHASLQDSRRPAGQ